MGEYPMFCHQGVAIRQCSTRPTRVAARVSKTLQHAHTPTHPPHSSAAALKTSADSSFHVSSILIPYSYHFQLLRHHPCTSVSRSRFNILGACPNARPLFMAQQKAPYSRILSPDHSPTCPNRFRLYLYSFSLLCLCTA
jgi:hypothetical protein